MRGSTTGKASATGFARRYLFNLDLFSLVPPLSCIVRTNYFDRLVLATVAPAAASAVLLLAYLGVVWTGASSRPAAFVKQSAVPAFLALTFFVCAWRSARAGRHSLLAPHTPPCAPPSPRQTPA